MKHQCRGCRQTLTDVLTVDALSTIMLLMGKRLPTTAALVLHRDP